MIAQVSQFFTASVLFRPKGFQLQIFVEKKLSWGGMICSAPWLNLRQHLLFVDKGLTTNQMLTKNMIVRCNVTTLFLSWTLSLPLLTPKASLLCLDVRRLVYSSLGSTSPLFDLDSLLCKVVKVVTCLGSEKQKTSEPPHPFFLSSGPNFCDWVLPAYVQVCPWYVTLSWRLIAKKIYYMLSHLPDLATLGLYCT